jgi:hypothetical protein
MTLRHIAKYHSDAPVKSIGGCFVDAPAYRSTPQPVTSPTVVAIPWKTYANVHHWAEKFCSVPRIAAKALVADADVSIFDLHENDCGEPPCRD